MTILIAILTVLCVLVLARWLVGGRPEAPAHVQLLPDGSVPDFSRPAPAAAPTSADAPEATDDEPEPREGGGVDAADVVRSGASVSPGDGDATPDDRSDTADSVSGGDRTA